MKFAELKTIGHNIADSLATGGVLQTGIETDVFEEAARGPDGYILIDFLSGEVSGAKPSDDLAKSVGRYPKALADLCARHGCEIGVLKTLTARYSGTGLNAEFIVTLEHSDGRRSVDRYVGQPGKRPKAPDDRGRLRPVYSAPDA